MADRVKMVVVRGFEQQAWSMVIDISNGERSPEIGYKCKHRQFAAYTRTYLCQNVSFSRLPKR